MLSCPFCLKGVQEFHPKSHIIPEWMYKSNYDGIHRMDKYDPDSLKKGTAQKGYWKSFICSDCESLFAKDDDFAANMFVENSKSEVRKKLRIQIIKDIDGSKFSIWENREFKKIQNFVFSVIIRWYLSKIILVKNRNLTDDHYQKIKKIYLEDNIDEDSYPIVITKIEALDKIYPVMLPLIEIKEGHNACWFMGGGYNFFTFISKHLKPFDLMEYRLRANGKFTMVHDELGNTNIFELIEKINAVDREKS